MATSSWCRPRHPAACARARPVPGARTLAAACLLLSMPPLASATDSALAYPAPPNPFGQPKPPPPGERRPASRLRRLTPRWQPVACLGLLSLAGAATKPHEPSLLAAIDASHAVGASVSSLAFRDCGVACVARYGELVWLGVLGRWLPLLPTSMPAAMELASSAGAAQLLLWATLLGYLLRKVLPRATADRHLSKSFQNVLRRGRLWTLLTASFCPSGLVHWLHANALLLLLVQGLEGQHGRWELLGLYAAAGLSAALLSTLGQLLFRRAAEPRPSVSGAVMGLLVLRAALEPRALISVGRWELPIARLLVLHLLLDAGTNAPQDGLGLSKLLDLLGGALMVAAMHPVQLDGEWLQLADWRLLLERARSIF